jgi:hypothetical protein
LKFYPKGQVPVGQAPLEQAPVSQLPPPLFTDALKVESWRFVFLDPHFGQTGEEASAEETSSSKQK